MTAQIVLLNQRAAAVASDSALTFGAETKRTYDTVTKIVEVGPDHAVVVMSAGCALVMNVMWDIVIGAWSRTLVAPLATLGDYVESFLAWVRDDKQLFDEAAQSDLYEWLVRDMFLVVRRDIIACLADNELSELPWDHTDVMGVVNDVVEGWCQTLFDRPELDEWTLEEGHAQLEQREALVRSAFDFVFDDVPRTEKADRRLLTEMPAYVVCRSEPWSIDATLTFAGFGEADLFPASQTIELTGTIAGRLLVDPRNSCQASREQTSWVTTPAQSDAMSAFLRGRAWEFDRVVHDHLQTSRDTHTDSVQACTDPAHLDVTKPKPAPAESIAEAHRSLDEVLETLSHNHNLDPFQESIGAMPPADLAEVARSLVGIEALHDRLTGGHHHMSTTDTAAYGSTYAEALHDAAILHADQFRKADEGTQARIPYVAHLLEVSALVWIGGGDETAAIAGLFHDAIEDRPERVTELGLKAKPAYRDVWPIVEDCSDGAPGEDRGVETWLPRKVSYLAHLYDDKASESALLVTAADKISNARAITDDVRMAADSDDPEGRTAAFWQRFNATPAQTAWYYAEVLEALITRIPHNPLTLRLRPLVEAIEEAASPFAEVKPFNPSNDDLADLAVAKATAITAARCTVRDGRGNHASTGPIDARGAGANQ